ncbi:hypothetical protein [Deinococcus sp. Leaf326]|uniref:hypothetical protein n=1 Tax=Deinococcus sp. Leaf326 TaxID=1736338 RepID=UPI0006F4DC4F|nr:hypothetical protein [Deinococcus sp. Leaf326]KQR01058.1 hypothetical protein ASF71_12940 [Deinococcus sp. Leaf326]
MTQLPPAALIFFGATDDLAYGQIFLAPRDLTARGVLERPVIGVARSDRTREQVIEQLHLENS